MKSTIAILSFGIIAAGSAYAQVDMPVEVEDLEPPAATGLEERIATIKEKLDGAELTERRRAYLEEQLEILDLQSRLHDAIRERVAALRAAAEGGLSDEERAQVREEVRHQFAEEIEAIKANRRALADKRRSARPVDDEVVEETAGN